MLYRSRVPQREQKGGNKESGNRNYTDQGYRRGRRTATRKRAQTEAIQPQSGEKVTDEESGYKELYKLRAYR